MAFTVKHVNDDASFLLSFEPASTDSRTGPKPEPFRILLDPWITGPSTILHPKMSVTRQRHQACITSLTELPEPDLVIISQHIPDHCNEATLRQLPAAGTKTIILAEPASARTIRSWKYFDKAKVRTIPKWDDWSHAKGENIVRIPLDPLVVGGEPGEVTVAFIPQRKDMMGLHSAVGITYQPPATSPSAGCHSPLTSESPVGTPPVSPRPRKSYNSLSNLFSSSASNPASGELSPSSPLSPTSPTSPGVFSLRSVRSASSIPLSISSYFTSSTAATSIATSPLGTPSPPADQPSPAPALTQPVLSVLFSPHGISYPSLQGYAEAHLAPRSALPLTALLHCFDSISNPWWLGGEILLGAPAGAVTAARLGARAWISAHDGDKEVKGLANGLLRTRRRTREEVAGSLAFEVGIGEEEMEGPAATAEKKKKEKEKSEAGGTEVMVLGIGEEVVLDREGVRRLPPREDGKAGGTAAGRDAAQAVVRAKAVWRSSEKGIPRVIDSRIAVTPSC